MEGNAMDDATMKALQLKVRGLLRCIHKVQNAESILRDSHSIKILELRYEALEARTRERLDHSHKILTEHFKDLLRSVLDASGISNVEHKIPQFDLDFETLEFFASLIMVECDPNPAAGAATTVGASATAGASSMAQTSSVIAPAAVAPKAEAGANSVATWFKPRMEKLNTVVDLAVLIGGMSALIYCIEHFSGKDIGAFTNKLSKIKKI